MNQDESLLEVIGVRIDADATEPQAYLVCFDSNLPIDCEGYPILFFETNKAAEAVSISNANEIKSSPIISPCIYDIAQAAYELDVGETTPNANICDCLNIILDFVSFLPEDFVHERYKEILSRAADHFTFTKDIKQFFDLHEITRQELRQAIEWAIGATALYAKFIY